MKKLKQSEIKAYRENMLHDQGGVCLICKAPCVKPVLDHAHIEPHKDKVRGVICNTCNIYEGKLRNASVRTGGGLESLRFFAMRVYNYITADYSKADWHPSKRKSMITDFKKLKAQEQIEYLIPLGVYREKNPPRNQAGRVGLFKRLQK